MALKARVFISCGQRKNVNYLTTITKENLNLMTPEFEIAQQISHELTKLGYEPYVALEQQKLEGVKEAIFERLRNSEYFLFIDFKREGLFKEGELNLESGEFRGSLFSHQELAIATFQGLEVLAFQEEGVKKDDGILKFIQANCKPFSDRKELPKIVVSEVKNKWKNNWRNELELTRLVKDYQDVYNNSGDKVRYFHIRVLNNHKDRIARNCVGYIEHYKNLQTGQTKDFELVELKWRGVTTQDVSIPPRKPRFLDAFHIEHDGFAHHVRLGLNLHLVDSFHLTEEYRVNGIGEHELDYVVFSEDFSPARAKFRLTLGKHMDDVKFEKII